MASIAGMSLVVLMAAGSTNIAEGQDIEHGAVMVGVGGGYIEHAHFQSDNYFDATFSFFAGLDKWGNVKGSLVFKRINDDGKPGVVISTEITELRVEQDVCPWIHMEGIAKLKAYWNPQSVPGRSPLRDHTFTLDAYDCDDGADQIWFELRYPSGSPRPGMSLWNYTPVDLASGHVMITYPEDLLLP